MPDPTPQDPAAQPPEAHALPGGRPTDHDKFFIEAQWRRIEEAPAVIEEAGKEIMSVAAVLSGVYFAAIELGGFAKCLAGAARLVLLIPYVLWIPAFVFGWLAFNPRRLLLCENAPDATKAALLRHAKTKYFWLTVAQWATFAGVVLMVIVLISLFLTAGGTAT